MNDIENNRIKLIIDNNKSLPKNVLSINYTN